MQQDFVIQLEHVCQRRRWRRRFTAACWFVAFVLALALLLVATDRLLGIADPVGRALLTIVFLVLSARIFRFTLLAALSEGATPLQVAHEVESRYPELRGSVANAWEFAQQKDDEPTAGSDALRRAVVLRASTALEEVSWTQFVPRKPLRQAAFALTGVGCVAAVLGWCLPQAMGVGISRLVNPLGDHQWPREHSLEFVDAPSQLIVGEDLVLQLQDTQGKLPSTITMLYRVRRQGRWYVESQELSATNKEMDIRRANVRSSLQYRATGGDHQTMPWKSLEVVEPPGLESLQVTVHPPAYTNLPSYQLNDGNPIYQGSAVELEGQLDQPVERVSFEGEHGRRLRAQLSSDGQSFAIDPSRFRIEQSESFRLKVTTKEGLSTHLGTELNLEVVADQSPEVRFVEPTTDLDVLPNVTIPLVIEATDELGIREAGLIYRRSDRSADGSKQISVWRDQTAGENLLQSHMIEFAWELEPLGLVPGTLVEVHAQADDAQPATGQTARALRLNVVSEAELWSKILEQQTHLVETMAQVLREQRELRELTSIWSGNPGWPSARWASATHSALFQQRQIADSIGLGRNNVLEQLELLLNAIERNRLPQTEAVDRLLATRSLMQSLAHGPLHQAHQALSELTRLAQRSADEPARKRLINLTARHQDSVLSGLRNAIDLLMPSNILGRLERDLAEIELEQKVLTEHCGKELAPHFFESTTVNSNLQAEIDYAVRRQRDLSRRLGQWSFDLLQAAGRFSAEEPAMADRLREATSLLHDLGTQATMQGVAGQLSRGRYGRASSMQLEILEDLAKLRSHLAGMDAEGAGRRLADLQAAERSLFHLRRELAEFERELRELTPERRDTEQHRLDQQRELYVEQTEAIARQLEELRMRHAAQTTRQATADLESNTLDSTAIAQAQRKLDEVQQQLTDARRRKQVALARLEMTRLANQLESWIGHQREVQDQMAQLERSHSAAGNLSTELQRHIEQLVSKQSNLREEVIEEAQRLTSVLVFAYLLSSAGNTMEQVEEHLQRRELSTVTQNLSAQAIQQLELLVAAVRQEQQNLAADSQTGGGAGQGSSADKAQQQSLQLILGQMTLLRSLQEELRGETMELESRRTQAQPLGELAQELARRQQQLAALASQLIPEPTDIVLPEVRQQEEE